MILRQAQDEWGLAIAAQAETWIGVPFVPQGRVRAGTDCKGFLAGVLAELGRPEADSVEALAGDYGAVDPVRLRTGLARLFDQVSERRAGDFLLCRFKGAAQHLAIAAPTALRPDRAIEAMPSGPGCVRPALWPDTRVDSIWRIRVLSVDRTNVRPQASGASMPPVSAAPEGLS